MGPCSQASALPFLELHRLPDGPAPWVHGGPANPKFMIVAGAWWLLREVEISCTRAKFVVPSGCGAELQ
eukprot:5280546-Pyramimonas_sp.AAC.1